VKAIESLMQKRGKFDYILLETTGLADPGPIAAMFWLDDELGSEIYLDGKIASLLEIMQPPCSHKPVGVANAFSVYLSFNTWCHVE